MRTGRRKSKVGFALTLLVLGLLWVGGGRALAHAELMEAQPGPGEVFYWNHPSEIRLRFTQALVPEESQITLVRVTSKSLTTVPLEAPTPSPDDPRIVTVALPSLEAGTYTVSWHTRSVDGHPLDGAYEFEVHFRQQIITMIIAGTVFSLMALLVFLRRARPGDTDAD